jgi:catechol 2,3-dioxygenase-like lactoylglutathione lyase family enzyme
VRLLPSGDSSRCDREHSSRCDLETPRAAGKTGGIRHFGFRLVDPKDIDKAVRDAVAGGGKLLRRGEFSPGFPYAYVADPDGYEVEIWYE